MLILNTVSDVGRSNQGDPETEVGWLRGKRLLSLRDRLYNLQSPAPLQEVWDSNLIILITLGCVQWLRKLLHGAARAFVLHSSQNMSGMCRRYADQAETGKREWAQTEKDFAPSLCHFEWISKKHSEEQSSYPEWQDGRADSWTRNGRIFLIKLPSEACERCGWPHDGSGSNQVPSRSAKLQ